MSVDVDPDDLAPDAAEAADDGSRSPPSQIFVLRLWRAPLDGRQVEWRGRLQHVNSGETRYFRAWPVLLAHLQALLGADLAFGEAGPPAVEPP